MTEKVTLSHLAELRSLLNYLNSLKLSHAVPELDRQDLDNLTEVLSFRIAHALIERDPICPKCGGKLIVYEGHVECTDCGTRYA